MMTQSRFYSRRTFSILMVITTLCLVGASADSISGDSVSTNSLRVGEPEATPSGGVSTSVPQKALLLSSEWAGSLGAGDWLFFTYTDRLEGNLGFDPDSGWPLANSAKWETWYRFDENGRAIAVLVRHTDLERGNITRVAWRDGTLLRDTSGQPESGHDWSQYDPFRDHFCNQVVALKNSVTLERWEPDATGQTLWVTITSVASEPVTTPDITGELATFVASETTCARDPNSGVIQFTTLSFVEQDGTKVEYESTRNYSAEKVSAPPAEMLNLLDKLSLGS